MKDKIKSGLLAAGSFLFVGGVSIAALKAESMDHLPYTEPQKELYFSNCTDARDAGYSNITEDKSGYRPDLDRDSDGVACETY